MTRDETQPVLVPAYIRDTTGQLKRLRRIEDELRGLEWMVESDVSCIDILTQISATTHTLELLALGLLDDHLHYWLAQSGNDPQLFEEKLLEASSAMARLLRS
jgi:DNA-binding FrmR family transcriptional regulator